MTGKAEVLSAISRSERLLHSVSGHSSAATLYRRLGSTARIRQMMKLLVAMIYAPTAVNCRTADRHESGRIMGTDTGPELALRKVLHRLEVRERAATAGCGSL